MNERAKTLFLDTSLLIEECLASRTPKLEILCKFFEDYSFFMACGFSRLEFKRVLLQNLALVLRYILEDEPPSFWRALHKASKLVQTPRRVSTLMSILAWIGHEVNSRVTEREVGDNLDIVLARRAESYLRNAIRRRWVWFRKRLDSLADGLQCQRGTEQPIENSDGSIDVSIRQSACANRECNNANFFQAWRGKLTELVTTLKNLESSGKELTGEIEKAIEAIEAAFKNPGRLYDYNRCLVLADVWIHLEAVAAGITNFGTTNYKESDLLCPPLGLKKREP